MHEIMKTTMKYTLNILVNVTFACSPNVLDLSGSGYGPVERSCEHGNEPSGSIKYWEILD
jgi:hypothetical protein